MELAIQNIKKRMTDVQKQSKDTTAKLFSAENMGKGMDPEMMATLRDHLSNIENDITINKEEFDKFKLNYLNDI